MRITPDAAARWLREHDDFVILTHRRPDGDTIGSGAALCLGLRAVGKRAELYPNRQITPQLEPYTRGLNGAESPAENSTIVAVDISAVSLLPLGGEDLSAALCLDHHGSNEDYAACTCVRPECASCAELIYEVLLALGAPVTKQIADALYLGVSTDTGCFQYANVTAETFRTAAALAEAGADCYGINKVMFATKSRARLQLESYLTAHMELLAQGRVGICTLPQAQIDRIGANEDDANGLSGFARGLEGVQIAVMLRDIEGGQCKISLRTGTEHDSAAICRHLGGGGHKGAAGATVDGDFAAARAAILDAIRLETGLVV